MTNYYQSILAQVKPEDIQQSDTSYFSAYAANLDPLIFENDKVMPSVRRGILNLVLRSLQEQFKNPDSWTYVWLAGSGVSYHWYAHRDPADLDCLVGINHKKFRQSNPDYAGLSNQEIADEINNIFKTSVHTQTNNYLGTFDLTFYAINAEDITEIRPYAAFSLTDNKWTVKPKRDVIARNPQWDEAVRKDIERTYEIVGRYKQHYQNMLNAPHDAARMNAETNLANAAHQGAALFDEIHQGRNLAFSPAGGGYEDFSNYRWQSGKEAGIIKSLKGLKKASDLIRSNRLAAHNAVEFPSTQTLIRRAALQNVRSRWDVG